jgi:excisionase family DNA binding protein
MRVKTMGGYSTGLSDEQRRDATEKPRRRMRADKPPAPEALLITITQTQRLLSISHVTVYAMIKAGKLKVVRIGGRTLIDHSSVKALAQTGHEGPPAGGQLWRRRRSAPA